MTPEQQARFDKSNKSMGHVKSIVGRYLLRNATLTEDRKFATDLVLSVKNLTVGVRLRDPKYAAYSEDITFRTSAGGSSQTELEKILAGNMDWMFYGFAAEGASPVPWYILDMNVFRSAVRDSMSGLVTLQFLDRTNKDGSTFRAYKLTSFPRSLIIGSSDMEKAAL